MSKTTQLISSLMCEMDPTGLTGGSGWENRNLPMHNEPQIMTINQTPGPITPNEAPDQSYTSFTDQDLQLAQQFIDSVGGPDRAQELIAHSSRSGCPDNPPGAYGAEDAIQTISNIMGQDDYMGQEDYINYGDNEYEAY